MASMCAALRVKRLNSPWVLWLATVALSSVASAAQFDSPAIDHTWAVPAVDPSGHVDVRAIVVTTEDKVVVFDAVSKKLLKLDLDGVLLDTWPVAGDSTSVEKLEAGPEGSVYQWNSQWGAAPRHLVVYDRDGTILTEWLASGHDLAVGVTGEVYRLVEYQVVVSTRDGEYLNEWDLPTNEWDISAFHYGGADGRDCVLRHAHSANAPRVVEPRGRITQLAGCTAS